MESIAPLISAGTISAVSPRKLYSLLLDPFTSRSMLDITGTYDFTYAPFTLPEKVVAALLPADWRFLRDDELRDAGVMTLPRPPEGKRFCCIQIGLQQKTGPNLPFGIGKNTFFEAKLEIPFLRHPKAESPMPITFKQTLLFSSSLMATSSSIIVGLRSAKVDFDQREEAGQTISARGYLSISDDERAPVDGSWDQDMVRTALNAWWAGDRTGTQVSRFVMTPIEAPQPRPRIRIRLNLPAFLKTSVQDTNALLEAAGAAIDEDGWLEVTAAGWHCVESTRLVNSNIGSL